VTVEVKEKNAVKARLIILAQMFYEYTDQDNPSIRYGQTAE
jgi:hypothetical protein